MGFNGRHGVTQNACNILEGCSSVEESRSQRVAVCVRSVPFQHAFHAWVYIGSHRVFTDEIEQDGQSENIINQN